MLISKKTPREIVLRLGEACSAQNCGKKSHCCSYSTGFLEKADYKNIAAYLGITEKELREKYLDEKRMFNTVAHKPKQLKAANKPYGSCVFLDEKAGCKIHSVKPLQCRLYTCKEFGFDLTQWFYLNHLVNPEDPQSIREYAEFIKFNTPIPGGLLEELVPDKEKLAKILSYEIMNKED
jgi:Fe-S-cluster containining protein